VGHYLDWSVEGTPAIWRYLLAVVLGFVIWTLGGVPEILLLGRFLEDPVTSALVLQYSFLIGLVTLPLLARLLLGRPWFSLALPSWPPRVKDLFTGMGVQWAVMIVLYLLTVAPFGRMSFRGWDGQFFTTLTMLTLAVVGFFIQTGFEELYFRGLLAQATRRVVTWAPVVIGLQAALFAQMHASNVAAWGGGLGAMIPYFCAALGFGWAAWRTGALTMSIGLHMGNNMFLTFLVATEGDVLGATAPFVAVTPEPLRAWLFAAAQLLLVVASVEWLTRRRRVRSPGGRLAGA
jgi:hypothetical protein